MAYWLSEANKVYEALYLFYNRNANLPQTDTGIFKGYAGCTKIVLLYTINALRENWQSGWYSDNSTQRAAGIAEVAGLVWAQTNFQADVNGIITFCNWVFVATKSSPDLQRYFAGGEYGQLTNIGTALTNVVQDVTGGAVEIVKNVLTVPSDTATLVQKIAPAVKWAAIIWGASKLIKAIKA